MTPDEIKEQFPETYHNILNSGINKARNIITSTINQGFQNVEDLKNKIDEAFISEINSQYELDAFNKRLDEILNN